MTAFYKVDELLYSAAWLLTAFSARSAAKNGESNVATLSCMLGVMVEKSALQYTPGGSSKSMRSTVELSLPTNPSACLSSMLPYGNLGILVGPQSITIIPYTIIVDAFLAFSSFSPHNTSSLIAISQLDQRP